MEKVSAKEKKYEIPLMKKFPVGCMENSTKQSSLLAKDCQKEKISFFRSQALDDAI